MADREVTVKLNVVAGNVSGGFGAGGAGAGGFSGGAGGIAGSLEGTLRTFQSSGVGGLLGSALGKAGIAGAVAGIALNQISELIGKVTDQLEKLFNAIVIGIGKASPATMEQWTRTWDDLLAVIGRPFIPAMEQATAVLRMFANMVDGVMRAIRPITDQLRVTPEMMRELRFGFGVLGQGIVELVQGVNQLFQAMGGLPALINTVTGALVTFGAVLAAIGELAAIWSERMKTPQSHLKSIIEDPLGIELLMRVRGAMERAIRGGFTFKFGESGGAAAHPAMAEGLFERGARLRLEALNMGRDPAAETADATKKTADAAVNIFDVIQKIWDANNVGNENKKFGGGAQGGGLG
jgi:hypothetical protein